MKRLISKIKKYILKRYVTKHENEYHKVINIECEKVNQIHFVYNMVRKLLHQLDIYYIAYKDTICMPGFLNIKINFYLKDSTFKIGRHKEYFISAYSVEFFIDNMKPKKAFKKIFMKGEDNYGLYL